MNPERRKYLLFAIVSLVTLGLDQWTKVLARTHLRPLGRGETVVVVDGFFKLRYSENTGVAFGLLQSMRGGQVILTLVALAAFALVLYYLKKTDAQAVRLQIALSLVGGGAIGNLVDRIRFGAVTDFVVWHYRTHEWPAFNVADAALVVGVGLMAMDMFRGGKTPDAAKAG